MRQLTLKDLLSFYGPCLSCGNKINLVWYTSKTSLQYGQNVGEFVPSLSGKTLTIDVKNTYHNKFSIMIDIMSHSILSSDSSEFVRYIGEANCSMQIKCYKCNSQVKTTTFKFDLNKRIIRPFSVDSEMWHITDDGAVYHIYTNMPSDETHIVVDDMKAVKPLAAWEKKIMAVPINRFSGKEEFLERIKTYMVFS